MATKPRRKKRRQIVEGDPFSVPGFPAWIKVGWRRYWKVQDSETQNRQTALYNARKIREEDGLQARVVRHPKYPYLDLWAVYYRRPKSRRWP